MYKENGIGKWKEIELLNKGSPIENIPYHWTLYHFANLSNYRSPPLRNQNYEDENHPQTSFSSSFPNWMISL